LPGEQEPLTKLSSLLARGIEAIQLEVNEFAASGQDIAQSEQETGCATFAKNQQAKKNSRMAHATKGKWASSRKISWSTQTLKRQN
jgi:hypothetical protein